MLYRYLAFVVSILLSHAHDIVLACAVCFGEGSNSKLKDGFFWGILFLFLLPLVIFSVITIKLLRLYRKK